MEDPITKIISGGLCMKSKVRNWVVLLASLFIIGFVYSTSFAGVQIAQIAEETNACGKKMTADMKAQKALDILEI